MKKHLLFTVCFIFLANIGWGQAEFRWKGAGGTAWENPANWTVINNHGVSNPVYPGDSSRVDDIVIINDNILPVGVQLANDISVKNLTIGNGFQVYINTNNHILTVTDQTVLKGIVSIYPLGVSSTSRMNITNLIVAGGIGAGIYNTSNVRINGALVSMDTSLPAGPITITIDSVPGNIGHINAGNRPVTINISNNIGTINIGDIDSSGSITITAGNTNTVNIGEISSGGNVTINAGTGSTVNVSVIDAGGTVSTSGAGTVNQGSPGGNRYIWNGAASGNWTTGANWAGGSSPNNGNSSCTIIIHSGGTSPTFSGTGLTCEKLIIQTGATLNMGANNINTGTLVNYGALTLAGSGSQSVTINKTPFAVNGTVSYGSGGAHFAGLTDFYNLTIQDGTRTGAGAITVHGNFTLAGGSLSAATVAVAGTSSIAGNVAAVGNQTYTGAVTLGGSGKRTISSQSGNIEFKSTLTSPNIIELLAASGNITIGGKTTALQLIAKAVYGTVSVNAIEINSATAGNEGENAAIFIHAGDFTVTTTTTGSIIPGGTGGHLCLYLNRNVPWEDSNRVIDGDEGMPGTSGARWHQYLLSLKGKILYSFTEDSNRNGMLDRIRVQTNFALYGDFSGFDASVEDYEIDRTKGVRGFQIVSAFTNAPLFDNDSFYIYLVEKPEPDGGNTPLWSITENTSLTNVAGSIVGEPGVDINIKPFDTIPPRIAYTLTLPGYPQTFVQMSETVVSSSGADVSASFGGLSVESVTQTGPAAFGYLFNLSDSFNINDLVKNIDTSVLDYGYFQMDDIVDKQPEPNWSAVDPASPPKYPLNWGYTEYAKVTDNTGYAQSASGTIPFSDVFTPPNKLLTVDMVRKLSGNQGNLVTPYDDNSVIRRVTDVLVSRVPYAAGDYNYFAWPVWARFKTPLNADSYANDDVFWGQKNTDTGIIWQFDGTNYLETSFIDTNDGIELQARINDNLTVSPELFWTTADVPVEYRNPKEAVEDRKTGGLWLPNVPALYYNYVLLSGGINRKPADSSSSKLLTYNISKDVLVIDNSAKFEFVFRLSNVSDMFIARLDTRGDVIPGNWYTLVRPFVFDIKNIRRQRGGVTVMNNVINSDEREVAFIRYHMTRSGRVTVQIYTLDGTLVKSLRRNEQRAAGEWTDAWDGTNNGGRAVARGMYFVRVVGPDIDEIRKIMVVK